MDLHVVPFPYVHIEHVLNCFKQRKRSYKETWLLYFNNDTSIKNVVEMFENRNAAMDYDDDFIIGLNMNNVVHLWELYRVSKYSAIQFNKIGQFSRNQQLELTSENKWHRRRNMKGHHFKMTSLPEAPFLTKLELDPSTGEYSIAGTLADLINLFASTLNYTYSIAPPPDNAWGGKLEDGSWNGMMNLLQKELVDIGILKQVSMTDFVDKLPQYQS